MTNPGSWEQIPLPGQGLGSYATDGTVKAYYDKKQQVDSKVDDIDRILAELSTELNQINDLINESGVSTGFDDNKPVSVKSIVKLLVEEITTEDNKDPKTQGLETNTPLKFRFKRKLGTIFYQVVKEYGQSRRILAVLDNQVNKLLTNAKVNYVIVENGQLTTKAISNPKLDKAFEAVQKRADVVVKITSKIDTRLFSSETPQTLGDLRNISVYQLLKLYSQVLNAYLSIIQAYLTLDAANRTLSGAELIVPTVPKVFTSVQKLLEGKTDKIKQRKLDLIETKKTIDAALSKLEFWKKKTNKTVKVLSGIQTTIENYYSGKINDKLSFTNSFLVEKINNLQTNIASNEAQFNSNLDYDIESYKYQQEQIDLMNSILNSDEEAI